VFGTYHLLGARYARTGDAAALAWRFGELRRSAHGMAPVARLALGHGVFAAEIRDAAKPSPTGAQLDLLRAVASRSSDRARSVTSALARFAADVGWSSIAAEAAYARGVLSRV
jgi:hypothetical protein